MFSKCDAYVNCKFSRICSYFSIIKNLTRACSENQNEAKQIFLHSKAIMQFIHQTLSQIGVKILIHTFLLHWQRNITYNFV